MTNNRMIARWSKARGWTYNVGAAERLGPKSARGVLVLVYGYSFAEAGEKMTAARNSHRGAPVALCEPRLPGEVVNA